MRIRKSYFVTPEKRESAPRHVLWIPLSVAAVAAMAVLQTYFLSHFPLFGAPIEWMLALLCLIACLGGPAYGAGLGALGGFFLDCLAVGARVAFLPLVLALCGVLVGLAGRRRDDGVLPLLTAEAIAALALAIYRRLTGVVSSFGGTALVFGAAFALSLLFTLPGILRAGKH